MCFGDFELKALIDSGSSISIIPEQIFSEIKDKISYKYISRRVRIKTINSSVECHSCINASFKINDKKFQHVFFIVECPTSNFDVIFGYDLIKQNNFFLNPHQGSVNFEELSAPLINCKAQKTTPEKVLHIDAKPLDAYLGQKIILKPKQTSYVELKIIENEKNFSKCFDNMEIYFEPNFKSKEIEIEPSLNILNQNKFSVLLSNNSNEYVHINKTAKLGIVHKNFVQEKIEQCSTSSNKNCEILNYITPSEEILQKRKEELSINDFNLNHLEEQQKKDISKLILENFACFSKSVHTIGHTDKIVPRLNFKSDLPLKTIPFPVPHALQDQIKKELDELQEAGIIERACTEWAAPMLLVKKKQDPNNPSAKQSYRMAIDLRLVNSVINHSAYPIPRIDTIIQNISKHKMFSVLDLHKAYWQIDLPADYREKLAFVTPWGAFKNNRLPFGCKCSASFFQALMDSLIDELRVENINGVYSYQDDCCVTSENFEEMLVKLEAVFRILKKYNITLSPQKCVFAQTSIDYLGFRIENRSIQAITANISKITSFSQPKTAKQLKRFLGLCSFYRQLVPAFAEIASPLFKLTSKNSKFIWDDCHQEAFQILQKIFFNKPFVKLPDWSKDFYLNSDASKQAVSAVLCQKYDDQLHPVAYYSKSLTPSQAAYPSIKLELMAIHHGVVAFKTYLYNRHFFVVSDSKPLQNYRVTKSPADIITRWLMELSEYSYTFVHIPGVKNVLADYLSRIPDADNKTECLNSTNSNELLLPFVENIDISEQANFHISKGVSIETFSVQEILSAQLEDSYTSEIIQKLNDPNHKECKENQNFFLDSESNILKLKTSDKEWPNKIVIPDKLKSKALELCHLSHLGIQKTYELLKERYFWKNMFVDTKNFVKTCKSCNVNKSFASQPVPLGSSFLPSRPNQFLSIDIVGQIPNCGYAFTIIDHFSKHIELYHIRNITAEAVTKCIFSYISSYGKPMLLLSDNGRQFISETFSTACKALGIDLKFITPYHPQANGVSERINSSLKSAILGLKDYHTFQQSLNIHKNIYNGTKHPSTGFSPNVLHFGRPLSLIFDTFDDQCQIRSLDKSIFANKLISNLNDIYKKGFQNLEISQIKQNEKFKHFKQRELSVNDIVYVKLGNCFKQRFDGPFVVKQKINKFIYKIQRQDNPFDPEKKVHIKNLRKVPARKPYLQYYKENNLQGSNTNNSYYFRQRPTVYYYTSKK